MRRHYHRTKYITADAPPLMTYSFLPHPGALENDGCGTSWFTYIDAGMLTRVQSNWHINCPSARLMLVRNACTKLFVGGLSYDTNETVLRDAFKSHGEIIEVRVICHHVSGESKGYGFVKFASEDDATSALKEMDGDELDGRKIRVHYAKKQ